jgi:hypothetical protein
MVRQIHDEKKLFQELNWMRTGVLNHNLLKTGKMTDYCKKMKVIYGLCDINFHVLGICVIDDNAGLDDWIYYYNLS